jgi:hypothetical protein
MMKTTWGSSGTLGVFYDGSGTGNRLEFASDNMPVGTVMITAMGLVYGRCSDGTECYGTRCGNYLSTVPTHGR